MFRKMAGVGAVWSSLVLMGCGSSTTEIKPTTQGGAKLDPAQAEKIMQESFSKMPPEQQAKMKAQMDQMRKNMQSQPPKGP